MNGTRPSRQLAALSTGLGLAWLCLAITAFKLWSSSPFSLAARRQHARHQQAFVLMVTLAFSTEAEKLSFIQLWKPLAAHVKAKEPGTLAFELLQPDTKPTDILVYERYIDKDYYLNVHKTSAAMAAFKAGMASNPVKPRIEGQSYIELNEGFML